MDQPYASAVSLLLKEFETRDWYTSYRGWVAIHANRRKITKAEWNHIPGSIRQRLGDPKDLPYGYILAIAQLTDCQKMARRIDPDVPLPKRLIDIDAQSGQERALGFWVQDTRYAFKLENVITLKDPIPHIGMQGFPVIRQPETLERIWAAVPQAA